MKPPFQARYPSSFTDMEFLSLFQVTELPECSEGLWLLKQWVESDPDVVGQLQQSEELHLTSLRDENPIFRKFLHHLRGCEDCRRGFAA